MVLRIFHLSQAINRAISATRVRRPECYETAPSSCETDFVPTEPLPFVVPPATRVRPTKEGKERHRHRESRCW